MNHRNYTNFRGVDFANEKVELYRSPNAINMWKNYKNSEGQVLETRPGITLLGQLGLTVYGLFFFDINNNGVVTTQRIVHAGTKLYLWGDTLTELFTGMNLRESQSFVFNNILFIKDGLNYLEYDGVEVKEVVGTIPTTSIGRTPLGETSGTDLVYQDVNLLSPYRKNTFIADGTTTYYLDSQNIESATVKVNGISLVELTDFTVDTAKGIVNFVVAPTKPDTDGVSNVEITYKKEIQGHKDRIFKSTILTSFDKRIFFAGNQDYPNTLFHSELEDPRYVRDTAYYQEGLDLAPIKALIGGNDVLWVIKENTHFYHTPTIDSTYGKIYPSQQSNITLGCVSTGINFKYCSILEYWINSKRGISIPINGCILEK